mgnify:CR=1 FL=1
MSSEDQVLVQVKGAAKGFPQFDWSFAAGQQWALMGSASAVKARLCAWVGGLVPPPHGVSVAFAEGLEDHVEVVSFAQQRAAAQKGGFLQARYHSLVDEAGPGDTVAEVLSFNRIFDVNPFEVGRPLAKERRAYAPALRRVTRLLNLTDLLDRDFLALSNGETRRVLLARALLAHPRLLILDDPCAGLDPERREQVKKICDALVARGLSLLVSVRHADELPSCVTDVLTVEAKGTTQAVRTRDAAEARPPAAATWAVRAPAPPDAQAAPVVELRDLHIAFGRRTLFDGFSWIVRAGERWVLRGPNGSGKTTLLALITGDSPLAYANDVAVFGHRRGAGVALAEIRRRIGMVSPELQAYTGLGAEELLEAALRRKPDLLLLDEFCLNLDAPAAARVRTRVDAWLRAHPACAAICVAHRPGDVPPGFTRECVLGLGGRG